MSAAIPFDAQVLVLNSDYCPLNVTDIARAVRLLFVGKAETVHPRTDAQGNGIELRAETWSIPIPSIIRLLYHIKKARKRVALTKKHLLLRDDYICGYCGREGDRRTMTVDHVIPRSLGGKSTWENLVAACEPCNGRKRDRTPEQAGMPLRKKPKEPAYIPFIVVKKHTADDEWIKYLTMWSISIEERVR
jgi:5-methylcytosine-specific restriction endonuclease McrA